MEPNDERGAEPTRAKKLAAESEAGWKDKVGGGLSRARDALAGGTEAVGDTLKAGVEGVAGLGSSIGALYRRAGDSVGEGIQRARNLAADATSTGGRVVGLTGGIVGEVSLVTAGVFPYLVFGDIPLVLGLEFGKLCAGLSQSVRGSQPQFMGVGLTRGGWLSKDEVHAVLYDPEHAAKDEGGFVQLDEQTLTAQLARHMVEDEGSKHSQVYMAAVAAVQAYKTSLGVELDTPAIMERED